MILQDTDTLPNGVAIPKLALGTWMIDDDKVADAVVAAVKLGYRHIDTAQAYGNERGVGEGIRACGVAREDLFVQTKLAAEIKDYDGAKAGIEASLETLGLDYIDLMIIHSPQPWADWAGEDRFFEGNLAAWKALEEAVADGKVRAIGISTHSERMMLSALAELEGLDYVMFPYNFIHARADYSQFLPAAAKKDIGLIAIKPLAAGSIVKLDPRANPGSKPENERIQLYQRRNRQILPAVVAKLTQSLKRMPEESLCQAALRFVYSRPFMTCAMPGMFQDHEVTENYAALQNHLQLNGREQAALDAARQLSVAYGPTWLPPHYRWLDQRWRS